MEDIIVAYQNITARQYVRNVDRLHRRWKSGNQTAKKNTRRAAQGRTTDGKSTGSKWIIMITEKKKEAQMQRKRKACRYVRNARKGLRRLSGQTQKGYSEELPDDNADFTDRGGRLCGSTTQR